MSWDHQLLIQARSFGAAAAAYERGRPSYPTGAIDWLLPAGARRVLDLGAGTGKLTRQLVGRDLDVVAVEPLSGMREQLTRAVPDVPVIEGAAEEIPLADHSVDVVLVAQAWHWVDPERAVPEAARVLSPGGRLGLVWNDRDEREEWVAELGAILQSPAHDEVTSTPIIGLPFGPIESFEVEWEQHLTPAALIDLAASRSYVITLPDDQREVLLAGVQHLINNHPALAGATEIALPYVTHCYRAEIAP